MEFILSSQTLLKSLKNISGIISSKPTLVIADNFFVKLEDQQLVITATDVDTMMTTTCPVSKSNASGSVCIPSKILLDYLGSLPEQPLNIKVDEEHNIEIHSENGQYKLKGEDPNKFPEAIVLENPDTMQVPSHVLNDGISYTLFSVSNDDIKKNLNGVYMEVKSSSLVFVSTDMHRLVKYDYVVDMSEDKEGVIIPRKPLNQLSQILGDDNSDIEIFFNDQFFKVKNERIELVTRLIDGKFPDYEAVIPKKPPFKLEVNKNDLKGAMSRVNIFANKSTNQISIDISANKLKLMAQDLDFSYEGDETISCNYDGDPMKISFNAKLLLELVSNMPGENIQVGLSLPTKPALFEPNEVSSEDDDSAAEGDDNLKMVIMPLNIQ